MVAYSTGTEGYLTRYGIDDIKSAFAAEIFQLDLMEIYKEQTKLRNDLRQMADAYTRKLRDLPQSAGEFADLIPLLTEIHRRLPQRGKLKYGYMPKDVKNLVDEVVNRLEKHPKVAELYELWYRQKCAIISTYTNNYPSKEPLSENEAFRPIKNAVLEAAVGMDLPEIMGEQEVVGALSAQNRHCGPESSGVFIGHEKDYNKANRKGGGGFSGKTAYFLYPNIEYAMACGISFVTLDTKGDLYRNMASIGEKYYGYHTVVYDFRKPMESDTYNLMSLVNKYMDR